MNGPSKAVVKKEKKRFRSHDDDGVDGDSSLSSPPPPPPPTSKVYPTAAGQRADHHNGGNGNGKKKQPTKPWKMPANTDTALFTQIQGDVLIKVSYFQEKMYVDLRKVFAPEVGEGIIYTQKGITLSVSLRIKTK
jgi:hypothetical protein